MKTLTILSVAAMMALPTFADDRKPADDKTKEAAVECKTDCKGKECKAEKLPQECWLDIETITVEAENGDPLAQYTIAYLTDQGVNIPKDEAKAKEMYGKAAPGLMTAAAKGHPAASYALAHMYAEGKGVEKDANKAAQYYKWAKHCSKAMKDGKNCCTPDNKDAQMKKAEEAATTNPVIDSN